MQPTAGHIREPMESKVRPVYKQAEFETMLELLAVPFHFRGISVSLGTIGSVKLSKFKGKLLVGGFRAIVLCLMHEKWSAAADCAYQASPWSSPSELPSAARERQ